MIEARSKNQQFPFRKEGPFKVIVCLITLWSFLFTIVPPDIVHALAKSDSIEQNVLKTNRKYSTSNKELNVETFALPEYLGKISDSWAASLRGMKDDRRRTIVQIQDAHCNYDCQHKIAEIIDYLNREYGVNNVNLEGGKDDYDLSVFTGIPEKDIREKVADYFVKEGIVNGAEYFAVNNPEKVTLWGIEDVNLYLENLNVYRDTLKHKDDIDRHLRALSHILSNLKRHVYTEELLEFDRKYSQYKAENIEFKDYLAYILNKAEEKAIDTTSSANINLLKKSLEQESNIDFRKADTERYELIGRLENILSRNELEELVLKIAQFKKEELSQKDFYIYLSQKAKSIDLDINMFPNLSKYIAYTSIYGAMEKSKVMDELSLLESRIKISIIKNDTQKTLDLLSKNLYLTKNLFDAKLTREDYEYYKVQSDSFRVRDYVKFIEEQAPLYNITARPDNDIAELDEYRSKMARFYECSFKRDKAFLGNMKFTMDDGRWTMDDKGVAILITGGFHTENLHELFKKNGISYVSIMPNFKNGNGYECPYYRLLAGKKSPIEEKISTIVNSTLAYYGMLNHISKIADNDGDITKHLMVQWQAAALRGKIFVIVDRNGGKHGFTPNGETTDAWKDKDIVVANIPEMLKESAEIGGHLSSSPTVPALEHKGTIKQRFVPPSGQVIARALPPKLWFLFKLKIIQEHLWIAFYRPLLNAALWLGSDALITFFAKRIASAQRDDDWHQRQIAILKDIIEKHSKVKEVSTIYYPAIGPDPELAVKITDAKTIIGVDPLDYGNFENNKDNIKRHYIEAILACGVLGGKVDCLEEVAVNDGGKECVKFTFTFRQRKAHGVVKRRLVLYVTGAGEHVPDELRRDGYDLHIEKGAPYGADLWIRNTLPFLNDGGLVFVNDDLNKEKSEFANLSKISLDQPLPAGIRGIWRKEKAPAPAPALRRVLADYPDMLKEKIVEGLSAQERRLIIAIVWMLRGGNYVNARAALINEEEPPPISPDIAAEYIKALDENQIEEEVNWLRRLLSHGKYDSIVQAYLNKEDENSPLNMLEVREETIREIARRYEERSEGRGSPFDVMSDDTIIRYNLHMLDSPAFSAVLYAESIGGNAGAGHAAVNGVMDRNGAIVAFGNIQNLRSLPHIREKMGRDVDDCLSKGILFEFIIRVKILENAEKGPDYEVFIDRRNFYGHLTSDRAARNLQIAVKQTSDTGEKQAAMPKKMTISQALGAGCERTDSELIPLTGDIWIKAGKYQYRIWHEGGKIYFRRHYMDDTIAGKKNHILQPKADFVAGKNPSGEDEYQYRMKDDDLADRHFSLYVSRIGEDYFMKVKNLDANHTTTVKWQITPAAGKEKIGQRPLGTDHKKAFTRIEAICSVVILFIAVWIGTSIYQFIKKNHEKSRMTTSIVSKQGEGIQEGEHLRYMDKGKRAEPLSESLYRQEPEYDGQGRVKKVLSYDEQNRCVKTQLFSYGKDGKPLWIKEYDSKGNLVRETDMRRLPDEYVINKYWYDENNNKTYIEIETHGNGKDLSIQSYSYEYDEHGNPTSRIMIKDGRLDHKIVYEYKYDENGNPVQEIAKRCDGKEGWLTYESTKEKFDDRTTKTELRYDKTGDPVSKTITEDRSGVHSVSVYDSAGNPKDITEYKASGDYFSNQFKDGKITHSVFYESAKEQRTSVGYRYDDDGYLASQRITIYSTNINGPDGPLTDTDYFYDRNGEVTEILEHEGEATPALPRADDETPAPAEPGTLILPATKAKFGDLHPFVLGLVAAFWEFFKTFRLINFIKAHENKTISQVIARSIGAGLIWAAMIIAPYIITPHFAESSYVIIGLVIMISSAVTNIITHAFWNTLFIGINAFIHWLGFKFEIPRLTFPKEIIPAPKAVYIPSVDVRSHIERKLKGLREDFGSILTEPMLEGDLTLYNQAIRPSLDGQFRRWQAANIKKGDVAEAWGETFRLALEEMVRNAAEGRDAGVYASLSFVGKITEIAVTARIKDERLIVAVEDDGEGIPERVLQEFERWQEVRWQGPLQSTKGSEGQGRGLQTIYKYAEQLGGKIEIDNRPMERFKKGESGTTVRLIFPIRVTLPAETAVSSLAARMANTILKFILKQKTRIAVYLIAALMVLPPALTAGRIFIWQIFAYFKMMGKSETHFVESAKKDITIYHGSSKLGQIAVGHVGRLLDMLPASHLQNLHSIGTVDGGDLILYNPLFWGYTDGFSYPRHGLLTSAPDLVITEGPFVRMCYTSFHEIYHNFYDLLIKKDGNLRGEWNAIYDIARNDERITSNINSIRNANECFVELCREYVMGMRFPDAKDNTAYGQLLRFILKNVFTEHVEDGTATVYLYLPVTKGMGAKRTLDDIMPVKLTMTKDEASDLSAIQKKYDELSVAASYYSEAREAAEYIEGPGVIAPAGMQYFGARDLSTGRENIRRAADYFGKNLDITNKLPEQINKDINTWNGLIVKYGETIEMLSRLAGKYNIFINNVNADVLAMNGIGMLAQDLEKALSGLPREKILTIMVQRDEGDSVSVKIGLMGSQNIINVRGVADKSMVEPLRSAIKRILSPAPAPEASAATIKGALGKALILLPFLTLINTLLGLRGASADEAVQNVGTAIQIASSDPTGLIVAGVISALVIIGIIYLLVPEAWKNHLKNILNIGRAKTVPESNSDVIITDEQHSIKTKKAIYCKVLVTHKNLGNEAAIGIMHARSFQFVSEKGSGLKQKFIALSERRRFDYGNLTDSILGIAIAPILSAKNEQEERANGYSINEIRDYFKIISGSNSNLLIIIRPEGTTSDVIAAKEGINIVVRDNKTGEKKVVFITWDKAKEIFNKVREEGREYIRFEELLAPPAPAQAAGEGATGVGMDRPAEGNRVAIAESIQDALKIPGPRGTTEDLLYRNYDSEFIKAIEEMCEKAEMDGSTRVVVDWAGINSILRHKGLGAYPLDSQCVLHSVKDPRVEGILGFPLKKDVSSIKDVVPVIPYVSKRDGKLHIFVTEAFHNRYLLMSHISHSAQVNSVKILRLAEILDHEIFEHSPEMKSVPLSERHHRAAIRARYFIPSGRHLSGYHKWIIDNLARTEAGRAHIAVILDEYRPQTADAGGARYEKEFYDYAKSVLPREVYSEQTQEAAHRIFDAYLYGDMAAFENYSKSSGIDPARLGGLIEQEENFHLKNALEGFFSDPGEVHTITTTTQTDVDINERFNIVRKRMKKDMPESEREYFVTNCKAAQRCLGGVIANFALIDNMIYQEKVTPIPQYLIELIDEVGRFEYLRGYPPDRKEKEKAAIAEALFQKFLESLVSVEKCGVLVLDYKFLNFGIRDDGEIVLIDLGALKFLNKEDEFRMEFLNADTIAANLYMNLYRITNLGIKDVDDTFSDHTFISKDEEARCKEEWGRIWTGLVSGSNIEIIDGKWIWKPEVHGNKFIDVVKDAFPKTPEEVRREWRRATFIPTLFTREKVLGVIMSAVAAKGAPLAAGTQPAPAPLAGEVETYKPSQSGTIGPETIRGMSDKANSYGEVSEEAIQTIIGHMVGELRSKRDTGWDEYNRRFVRLFIDDMLPHALIALKDGLKEDKRDEANDVLNIIASVEEEKEREKTDFLERLKKALGSGDRRMLLEFVQNFCADDRLGIEVTPGTEVELWDNHTILSLINRKAQKLGVDRIEIEKIAAELRAKEFVEPEQMLADRCERHIGRVDIQVDIPKERAITMYRRILNQDAREELKKNGGMLLVASDKPGGGQDVFLIATGVEEDGEVENFGIYGLKRDTVTEESYVREAEAPEEPDGLMFKEKIATVPAGGEINILYDFASKPLTGMQRLLYKGAPGCLYYDRETARLNKFIIDFLIAKFKLPNKIRGKINKLISEIVQPIIAGRTYDDKKNILFKEILSPNNVDSKEFWNAFVALMHFAQQQLPVEFLAPDQPAHALEAGALSAATAAPTPLIIGASERATEAEGKPAIVSEASPIQEKKALVHSQTEAAKAVIHDLRQNVLDVIATPTNEEAVSEKASVTTSASRFFRRNYGTDTIVVDYVYNPEHSDDVIRNTLEQAFESILKTMGKEENRAKSPRAIAFFNERVYEIAQNLLTEEKYAGMRSNITLIKETLPDSGLIDEVMHVVLGKALLNYQRNKINDEAKRKLLDFIKTLVSNPNEIDFDNDRDIINKILNGELLLKIVPKDFKDIQDYKDHNDEVLRSL